MSQVSQDHEIYVILLKKYTKVFGFFFFKPKCLHHIVVWGFTVEAEIQTAVSNLCIIIRVRNFLI